MEADGFQVNRQDAKSATLDCHTSKPQSGTLLDPGVLGDLAVNSARYPKLDASHVNPWIHTKFLREEKMGDLRYTNRPVLPPKAHLSLCLQLRQTHRKGAAFINLAGDTYCPAVIFHNALHDGQSESGVFRRIGPGLVHAVETLENVREII